MSTVRDLAFHHVKGLLFATKTITGLNAWGVKINNKLDAMNIFQDKEAKLEKGEKLVRVEIKEI